MKKKVRTGGTGALLPCLHFVDGQPFLREFAVVRRAIGSHTLVGIGDPLDLDLGEPLMKSRLGAFGIRSVSPIIVMRCLNVIPDRLIGSDEAFALPSPSQATLESALIGFTNPDISAPGPVIQLGSAIPVTILPPGTRFLGIGQLAQNAPKVEVDTFEVLVGQTCSIFFELGEGKCSIPVLVGESQMTRRPARDRKQAFVRIQPAQRGTMR